MLSPQIEPCVVWMNIEFKKEMDLSYLLTTVSCFWILNYSVHQRYCWVVFVMLNGATLLKLLQRLLAILWKFVYGVSIGIGYPLGIPQKTLATFKI
jgi:hypothetical protein